MLIISVILQLEQRKREKKKSSPGSSDTTPEQKSRCLNKLQIRKGDMTYVSTEHFWRKLI